VAAHAVTLAAAGGVLALAARGLWFFGDEWDFLADRGLTHAEQGLLVPHNEHWSTIPILAYRALFALTGVRSYWPYMLALIALHLVAVHLLWRLLRRVGTDQVIAAGLTAGFAVLGAGAQNLLWAFQIGFIGSLVAAFALALLLDRRPSSVRGAGVGALVGAVSLMLSGISVIAVGVAGLVSLGRAGWRRALLVTVPPTAVYLVWLVAYGSSGLSEHSAARGSVSDLPGFVGRGLVNALGRPLDAAVVGVPLLVALAAYAVAFAPRLVRGSGLPAVVLAAGAVALYAVIGVGRNGFHEPGASRYVYLGFGLLAPLLGMAISDIARRAVVLRAVSIIGVAVLTGSGVVLLFRAASVERKGRAAIERQLGAALDLVDRGEPRVGFRPDPLVSPDVTTADLIALRRDHGLPAVATDERDALNVAVYLQLVADRIGRGGCVGITASPGAVVLFRMPRPATVDLGRAARGDVVLWLASGDGLVSGGPRTITLRPGVTRVHLVRRTPTLLGVRLPAGHTQLCFRPPVRLLSNEPG
jgi:hypothetical protein